MDPVAYMQTDKSGLAFVQDASVVGQNKKTLKAKRTFMTKLVKMRAAGQQQALT